MGNPLTGVKHMKKISIITITYNNLFGLKRTVESVYLQTAYDQIEYIIIDGASSDGSVEYLKSLPDSIIWISEPDRGISHAFNKGIERSSGEMILCLNSGDIFTDNNVVKEVIKDIENSDADIISYKVKVTDSVFIPSTDVEQKIWNACEEPHQGTFVKRRIYDEIGGYSEEYKIRMDYHFFARCKSKKYSFKYFPTIIVEYEPGGTSMAIGNRRRSWREGMSVKMLYDIETTVKDFCKAIIYSRHKDS